MEYEELKEYKSFNCDMTTSYNDKFEERKIYTVKGPPNFGNPGNGFHSCLRLEDTLRYHNDLTSDIKIAEVTSPSERTKEFYNEY